MAKAKKTVGRKKKVQLSPQDLRMDVKAGTVGTVGTFRYDDITKVNSALKDLFSYTIYKTAMRFRSQLERALIGTELQSIHLGILITIGRSEPCVNQNQLAEQIGIDKASLVKIIDRLENCELIVRKQSAKDRRVNFIQITKKGEECMKKAQQISEDEERKFLSGLSSSEAQVFKSTLLKLLS